MTHDPLPCDLMFAEPHSAPFASYARRERSEIHRALCLFTDDADAAEHEAARIAMGMLHSRGA